ncbi:tRNA-specific adenosine deaminase [Methanobrevibacter sp. 87.7]|uniref:nucleoside deaminase n=1 Tax=Methanobrevibacter sp. 87.7 TaxID=387957 RepID=UPI000B508D24|nr:nucleoside deaminase [Methanobrevibacter sp. 87.7]OWT33496.1 tRNA-specific adenosine deaminase [Methanobrevibacter sp. 87.7]
MDKDIYYMNEAINEAKKSLDEGGIPIGAVLVSNDKIVGRGHNRMIQEDSPILHGEIDAINNAGRLTYYEYMNSTLYTTLSPCPMCSGAIVLYNIPRIVVGENVTLMGAENFLESNNVEVKVLQMKKIRDIFDDFIKNRPEVWEKEKERVSNSTSCNSD